MKYDFKCEDHGVFEVEQKMSECTKTHKCPECENECPRFITVAMFNCPKADGDYKYKKANFGQKR